MPLRLSLPIRSSHLFSNRELALIAWSALFIAWGLYYPAVRSSAVQVLRSALHRQIVVPFLVAAAYVCGVVALLRVLGIWTPAQLKDTVFWFLFTGITAAFGLVTSWKGDSILRHFAKDAIKITIIIEFLTDEYTLFLPWGLVVVPVVFMLVSMDAIAGDKAEFVATKRLLGSLQILVGLGILTVAVRSAIADWKHLRSLDSLRSLLVAPTLSLLFVPFAIGLLLYTTYQSLFVRIALGAPNDEHLRAYARRQIFRTYGFRLRRVYAFSQRAGRHLWSLQSPADVDALLVDGHPLVRE